MTGGIRSRDEHYVDEWENVIMVRSIYGGDCAGPFDSHEQAQQWINERRAAFDRDATEWDVAQGMK